ncbi:Peptidase C48 domain containing protein [Pyrenophora teres f. maculata]|nr:Peptidase C48 domain containing protein [Pyrenophora teres f. maculata]
MSWPEDNAKQFAPAQVIAQVAPPSPVSAPLPGAHTKPQSDADIAPEPADTLPLSSRIPTAMSESDSILCLVLSAAGVDSPKGAQPRINPKVRSVSPVDDINSSSKASDHKILELRLQEETQVANMRPITPPLTQNCDTGVSATSSITPLPIVHEILPDSKTLESPIIYSNAQKNLACGHVISNTPPSSQDRDSSVPVTPSSSPLQTTHAELAEFPRYDTPALPTPSSIQTTSSRASWSPGVSQDAISAHYKRAKGIYGKTRYLMRTCTNRMSLVASRGFQRGSLPTRRTRPPLRKRRYSVDVNTVQHWTEQNFLQDHTMLDVQRQNHETDPVPLSTTVTDPVPNPFRYPVLSSRYHYNFPQFNEDVYLRLGDAVLETDAYGHIGLTDGSYEAWMTGDSLDMAMEVLRRDEQCHAHGIAIANSAVAQICYFAHMSDDSSPQEYKEYKIQYEDKRWIFIIINDAIGGFETDIDQGSHWSFIAMDREGKTVHYYDSMEAHEYGTNYNREMGQNVGAGMLKILGEDTYSWKFVPEYLTPNQNYHNRSTSDGGACGPFVFKMMQYLIRQTIYWQSFGRSFPLGLESGFPLWFRDNHFDSRQIRREIQTSIARWKAIVEGIHLANIHDQAFLLDEDVVLGYAPVETFWYPPQNLSTDMDYEKGNVTRTGIDREMSRPSTTDDTVLPTSSDPMEVDLTLEDAENEDEYDGGVHIVIHNNSDDENESLGLLPPLFTPSVSDDDEYYDMWR